MFLTIMRHGEAEQGFHEDHKRSLTENGQLQVNQTVDLISQYDFWPPDKALVSDASRAQQTWDIIKKKLPNFNHENILTCPEFYGSSFSDITKIIEVLAMDAKSVLVVGHNPTWSILSSTLTATQISLSTSDAVTLENKDVNSWISALSTKWTLVEHTKPQSM